MDLQTRCQLLPALIDPFHHHALIIIKLEITPQWASKLSSHKSIITLALFDRPSNAIDWLIKEAKSAIDVLNADQYHHLQELVLPDTATYVICTTKSTRYSNLT